MKFATPVTVLFFSMLTGTAVLADPPPQPDPPCKVFCFRITDIRADKNDAQKDKFHIEFEVLNWADTYAGGIKLALAAASSPGVQFANDNFFNFNGVDADGRPLQLEDTNGDMVINAADLEDANNNGLLDAGEDKNNNNRLDNDPIPGNLNRNNTWTLTTQTATQMEWALGTAIPFINMLAALNDPQTACGSCFLNARTPASSFTIDPNTGEVMPLEVVDNGDNVQ